MRLLRTPTFGPLLAGQAVNAIGNWVALVAVWGIAAFRFDAGAGDLALLLVVLSVPGVVLGPFLGLPIDRLGPRRTLILANGLGLANALTLTQARSYAAVMVLAIPLGLVEALASASLDALPPRLVADEDLVQANALLGGADDLAVVVGPAVAAVVNSRWGLSGAFLADALTFLVGLGAALRLRAGLADPDARRSAAWVDLGEGAALARRTPEVAWTLAVAAVTYGLWALFAILEPLYVRDVLGRSDTVFALLQSVFGVGLVGAGLALAGLGDRMARPRYVALATVASGGTAALYLGTRSLVVAAVGVFLWGVDVAFFYVPAKTLLQRHTPAAAHGRIMSINQTLEPLATLVMSPIAAVMVGVVGVRALGVVGGLIAAAAGLVALHLGRRLGARPVDDSAPRAQ
ncbi:MAG: MFS transporter [Acidimicrobiales bacterium]